MAINPKDFMSTQTGGEGSTIQAEIETATPEQFKANISPVQQAEQTVEAPAIPQVPSVSESIVETPVEQIQQPVIVSEEDKIYSDLGLLKSEVDIPEQLNAIESRVIEDEITQPEETAIDVARYTEDGDRIMSASDLYSDIKNTEEVDSFVDESLFNDAQEAEEISLNYKTEDGLSIYSPSAEAKKQTKTIQSEYSNLGINVDGSGRVEVKKPSDNIYPKYKLPDTGVSYEKRPDGWYKDDGKGNYIKLKTDVERRSAYLDKNAVPVSEFGTGTKNTQNGLKIINERVGPLRSSNTDNVLTSGGDPTISDGLSFNQLTRSNIGKSSEKYNQDGTLNFNYDSKYENVPREVRPLLEYSGKPDGIYVYPGNDASYKKENGNWYKKPKGSSEYIQLKGEGVDQRISNLEMKAVASFKVKDASALINNKALLGSTKNLTQEYDNLNKVLFSGDGGKIGRYEESFEDAKNFANKDINLLLKDDMTLEQRQGLMDYQKRLNDIVSDGEYSLDKAIKTSQILKEAEQFFATSKDINKSINEAAQAGVSMARMSFENKKKTFQNTFLSGIAVEEITGSEFQKDAFDMFVATGSMADFFIENTDNGKIRFDSKSGQYVISKDISEIERKYIDEKLGQLVNQYNELQNKKFAETNEKVSKYKRSLSNINSNISKIEESLQGMRNAGMKVDDPAYVALSSQLDKERKKAEYLTGTINEAEKVKSAAFLTEPKKTAKDAASNLSQDAKNIFKAIPASVPPKQRFDLFYENLQKETTKFKKDNGIDESRLSGMNMAFKDLLDWDDFYALTEAEKRYAQNVATLRQLAPLYYNNDFGITQESAGFWESFVNSFYQSLFPNIAKAKGFDVQTSAAGKIIEVAAEEGYSEEDFIDSDALDKLRDRAVVDFNTMEKWGGMLGTTAGIIVPLMATRKLPSTALRVASNVERVIIGAKATADASKTVGIIANAEKVYDAVLSSNKIGRFLRPAIESGVRFEVAGTVFNQEELNFLSGLAGGVASEALSGVLSKIPKEQVYGYLSSVFGSQTSRAVNVIKATADASARGIAETGEEFAQEMTNIYKETDSFKGMMTELSNRFGTFDQVQEFVISSFILGAAFGVVDGKQGKDVLAKMPEEKRNQVNQALVEVNSSLLQADNAVDEYVENKLTQEAINKSVEEYDKKDEQGVSGQVGEGEKPVEGQPDVEAGQEAPSPSGMVQEEQTGVEPVEERVTATTAEEAKALWDQGYRPSVEGVETRGGKDMAIDNIFNTRKEVDMVRMVTPEATTQVETIDVYHGGSMDEKTGDIYVTEDKGQATEYAKGNDGNVIKYSIPKDKVASEEEVANTISELGIDTNEEAKLFELIDPRFEETYIGDENKQKLFDSLKDKGFEAASFIDEDLTLREKGGVRNIVVFEAERLSPSSVTVTENQAENLYDQGYRPVIDGETQADYNKENIGDLFEQSERIEMALPTQAETQAEAETEQKGFEKLAEKVREFKLKPGDLTGGDSGIAMSSVGIKGFEKAWNTAVEAIAQTIIVSGNSAEAIQKAIDAGFKTIKESDWYKSLNRDQKKQVSVDYNEGVNKMFPKEKLSKEQREGMKDFKEKVAEVTGTAKPQKTVQRTASQALKDSIRDREKGWKMGQKNLQDIKEQVRDYAKENLPKDDYSKKEVEAIMNSITNAKTPNGLEKALDRVDAMVNKKAEAKRKRTIKDIQKKVSDKRTVFSKRGNKWVGKVSVDSQKEFFDFINSPALSNLDTKTQEELDAINDVIDGILSEGKADYSAVQRLEAKAKRQRAAKLIEGLAKGKQKELKGIDAVRDWLDKGNVVIINGEMFRKSDLKSLEFNQATAKRKRVALEKKLEKLKPTDYNAEFEIQSATQEMIELDLEIKNLEEQISEARDTERALSEAGVSPDATFVGYQQEVLSEQRSAQSAKKSKLRGLNPINAVNDIYSLLKSAYSGSSAVTKFIKENIERPIKKAYFEKMKGYQAKISEYYNNLEDIFGSKEKGLNYLSSLSSVNPTTSVLSSKEDLPVTNGHMVDWYNLIRTNENGDKRMESGNKDPKAIISYVESDPKLKAYADYLLNEYNGNLRLEYEPVYQSYTNTPFGDTTYYPSYAAGFEDSFVSEDDLMSDSPKFNMMNATARNLKQRTNYSGPFDTRLDAHAKFFDYVKTMEHAKHFMPIAKSANELFSKMNNAYLIDNMGVDNFADLKEHLGVILSDAPLKGGGFSNALSGFRSFSVVATLGGKLASIPKQFSSFTHYWTAGIELGVNPIEVMFAVPEYRDEWKFAAFIITSPYVKERYTGDSIDLEVRALSDKALKSNTEDAWEALSKGFLWPVRFGDRTSISTGGGQFALAVYRKAKIDGMSESEARDYAYEQFVTQSEATQQSTRSDFTSLIQRDPTFRTIAMYRTGQMANAKKVVNGVKTIYQAYNIEKSEGTDARAEAISDDEIVQSIVDIMYYSTVGSWLFNAIASGALYYLWASETDDDDRDRMLYNLAMEQVSSNLQGYGATGYIAEFFFNALRGDEWKNNVPVLRTIENLSSVPPSFISAMLREWPNMTTAQRKQWLIDNKMPFEIKGRGSDVELEKFMEAFGDYPAWYKMNDSEKEQIIKNIGGGNINTLIKNTGKFIEGEGDWIKVLMNYEDQYMQKEKELGKKDLLWELITGEPYVKKDKNEKIKTDLIFPEAIKKENLQESLVPKLD